MDNVDTKTTGRIYSTTRVRDLIERLSRYPADAVIDIEARDDNDQTFAICRYLRVEYEAGQRNRVTLSTMVDEDARGCYQDTQEAGL
jgi:hypothetical protein